MYTRNGKPKAGAWVAHARYLTREGAQLEHEKGRGFDVERGDIDLIARVREWEKDGDELMWRFIVSPEDADRMDLKEHIRELVRTMEADLGTRLEWVAIDHNNTDNPHVHLLVRGVDERGKALMIDREYVRTGIRARSQEIASRELGPRLEPEMLRARERPSIKSAGPRSTGRCSGERTGIASSITAASFHTTRRRSCGPSRKCGGFSSSKG